MKEHEFVRILRWVFAGVLIISGLIVSPALVSATSNISVMAGLFVVVFSIVVSAMSLVGRLDTAFANLYRDIHDAFFT